MGKIRVAIVGATGHTGGSVVNGLLEEGSFVRPIAHLHCRDLANLLTVKWLQVVAALVRPKSIEKPIVGALRRQGVEVREADLEGPEEELVRALNNIDVVISCVRDSKTQQQDQISLANAAKIAGVKRFVPCGFGVVAPPTGVMRLRELVSYPPHLPRCNSNRVRFTL